MSIDLSKVTSLRDKHGNIAQLELGGRIIWLAVQKVKVTITSQWDGFDGDSASITITSKMPFAPNPSDPSNKVTTWTYFVYDQPNYTIEVPEGSTIQCTVSRDKGNADSHIKLNGSKMVTGEGSYVLTVTRDVTISIEERYSQGDYGVITILESGAVVYKPVILEVEKITSDTYAGETTYTGEQFILLDIYPKTNGTVSVTYGGLTKTITDTSVAEEPNAQQVFFGTFNGVTDGVATPLNGTLTIDGDYKGVGVGTFAKSSKSTSNYCGCITKIKDFGNASQIPNGAFRECTKIESIILTNDIVSIGSEAFYKCIGLKTFFVAKNTNFFMVDIFKYCDINNPIIVDAENKKYVTDGNCLISDKTTVVAGFLDSVIPSYVTKIGNYSFFGRESLKSIVIPSNVKEIGTSVFLQCSSLTSVTFENTSGWYVKKSDGTTIEVDVSNPTENATLLNETYAALGYSWYRS